MPGGQPTKQGGQPTKAQGIWEGCVFLYSQAAAEPSTFHQLRDLLQTLEGVVDSDLTGEVIDVKTYKQPLSEQLQWTNLLLFHEFVILRTPTFYWSIEKGGDGIHIQRSDLQENVRSKFNQERRISGSYWTVEVTRQPVRPRNAKTARDVIEWVWEFEVNRAYEPITNNCKDLARRVYSYVKS